MNKGDEKLTIHQAFENFIAEKKALQLSADTIKAYRVKFKAFTDFFSDDNLCCEISSSTVFQFIEFLKARNPDIKTVTINTYLVCV